MVAFLLARCLVAIRADRLECAADLLLAAEMLVERWPHTATRRRTHAVIEALAGVGFERHVALEAQA